MSSKNEAGFTLIEVIIVMAISSLLMVGIFAGQRDLRSRAQFDAAVNKLVASVSDAHTQATAAVNILGSGDGTIGCPGGSPGQYVFAGIAWTADDSLSPSPLKMDYYKATPGNACIFQTQNISVPAQLQVNADVLRAGRFVRGGRVLFVRNDQGGLAVCSVAIMDPDRIDPANSFRSGICTGGATRAVLTLTLTDIDGHKSQVTIDQSGLARRIN